MKNSILSLLMLAFAAMTSAVMAQEIIQGAAIDFEKDVHDYGDIAHNGNGTYSFVFKNTGNQPLIISDAKGSCGCTVPNWPKEPISPGASAKIDVTYDTKRVGAINKSVTIMSNAENTPVKVIKITGNVLSPDATIPVLEEEVIEEAVEMPVVDILPVSLTKKEIKAKQKAEKKRLKKEAKAAKKAAKLALKKEKAAKKAEAKAA